MTAPNITDKMPTESFYVTNGDTHGLYWTAGAVKVALKVNTSWTTRLYDDEYRVRSVPHPGLVIWRIELGLGEDWKTVTEQFVKDGKWAW